ncbi:MAG: hypothetical protein M5U09_24575 [Gammaproteobacteria bacterium]|nr:hypothetical protein [Gammaproteobacteria bacterium]
MGLIWKCVDDEAFDETVEDVCRRLADGPTTALALAKRAIAVSGANSLEEQLDLERDFQAAASASGDYGRGFAPSGEAKTAFRRTMTTGPAV